MYLKNALDKGGGIFKGLLIIAAAAALTLSSQSSRECVKNGVELCLGVLIPSLFPFMALSTLAVKSRACHALGKSFGRVTRLMFGLSGTTAPIILLSLIGGYPVGARGIAQLRENGSITEEEAKKAAMFAVCAGPGFLINYVGAALYGSAAVGLTILLAQICSVIILGIAINLFDREKENYNSEVELSQSSIPFSQALVESTYSAARGMGEICALVLIFSAATGIAEGFCSGAALDAWRILSEVCSAALCTSQKYPLYITAFAVGFGGICVHFQIFSALRGIKINKLLFFLIRIIQGIITALMTQLFSGIFIKETAVFSSGEVGGASFFGGSAVSALVLTAVSVCFILSIKNIYRR